MPDAPLLIVAVFVFLASLVQTTIGFGAGLIAITGGCLVMPLPEVLALVVPVLLVQAGMVVVRHHREVSWSLILREILPYMSVGLVLSLGALALSSPAWLKMAFGVLVLAMALRELLRSSAAAPPSPWVASLALVGAGFVHGLFATGGPLLVWAMGTRSLDKGVFRTTLIAVFMSMNVALCVVYVARGTLDGEAAAAVLVLAIPVIAGNLLGERLHDHVDRDAFQKVVWVALALAAVSLVVG